MSNRVHFWQRPLVGAIIAVGAALWEAVQTGDLARYASWPVAIFLVAIAQVIYALTHERNELRRALDSVELRRKLADTLGRFLQEADKLQPIEAPPDEAAIAQWERRVVGFLQSEPLLGAAYVARFGVGAGITITVPEELQAENRRDRKRWWCHVHTRRARLVEFIGELRRG